MLELAAKTAVLVAVAAMQLLSCSATASDPLMTGEWRELSPLAVAANNDFVRVLRSPDQGSNPELRLAADRLPRQTDSALLLVDGRAERKRAGQQDIFYRSMRSRDDGDGDQTGRRPRRRMKNNLQDLLQRAARSAAGARGRQDFLVRTF